MSEFTKKSLPWLDELLKSHGYNTFQLRDNVIDRFEQEQIDEKTLLLLSEQDFIDLGVPLGPRKALTKIIATSLSSSNSSSCSSSTAPPSLKEGCISSSASTTTTTLPWLDSMWRKYMMNGSCFSAAPKTLVETLVRNDIITQQDFASLTQEDLGSFVNVTIGNKKRLELLIGKHRLDQRGSSEYPAFGDKLKDSVSASVSAATTKPRNNSVDDDDDDDIDKDDNNNNNNNETRRDIPAPSTATTTTQDTDVANERSNHQENNKSVFIGELKEKANKLLRAGDHSRALELYSRALSVDPQPNVETHAALLSNRSACYLLLQQAEKALEDAEACLRLRPEWIKGHIRKIKALKELGRKTEAVKAVVEAHHHVGADPQLLELAREIPRIDDKIDETRPRLDPDIGNLIARGDVDAIKARLSGDDARDVLLSVDGDGDNCLAIACYAHAPASVLQLLVDRSEELGILSEVLSSTDNKGHGCLLIGLVRNLHRQSLEVVLNALAKVGLLKNVLDVSKDPNPLLIVCSGNLNVNSFIGLLNAYSAHLPLTPEHAVVALGYAASNRSMTQNVFHVLLRETARLSVEAKQPLLFAARFNDGQTLLHILAKNNRTDLLRIFIPFFESSDQFNVILTTPDQYGKLVTSNTYATSATVRDLLTPESFSLLRNKYKLTYGRTARDTTDALENTNIKIPWLQELFPDEPLDEPTVNLLVDNEIDQTTVFDLTERDIQDFPLRIRSTLIKYIRLKNPTTSKVKVDEFVTEQANVDKTRAHSVNSIALAHSSTHSFNASTEDRESSTSTQHVEF